MSIMVLSGTVMSFGEESISERADTTHRSEFRNKAFLGYTIKRAIMYLGDRDNIQNTKLVIGMAGIAELIKSDYGSQGVLYIVGFYILRKHRLYQVLWLRYAYIFTTGNEPTIYLFIASIIILLYNGKRGRVYNKYFFYWLYPLHLLVLNFGRGLLVRWIGAYVR